MKPHWLTDEEIDSLPSGNDPTDDTTLMAGGNPVRRYGDLYYYWDEVWRNCFGPFDTEQEADQSVSDYAKAL
jgi:hypothetical protein